MRDPQSIDPKEPLKPATKPAMELAHELEKANRLSEAWTALENVPSGHFKAQLLRSRIRYRQRDIAAARQEAAKYAELYAPSLRHARLTELFDDCLRQVEADNEANNKEAELANWLWPRINLPSSSKSDWLIRLRWGLRMNKLVRHWILTSRDRLDELDELVDPPDWSLLATAKAEQKPVVVAGAHLGPRLLGLHYLNQVDHPLVTLVGNPSYSLAAGTKPFLLADEPHSIVELRNILGGPGTVYLAGDGRRGRSRFPASLFGSPVYLREGVAVLAWHSKAQTFWYAARWTGHRIQLELVPGPTPLQHETREAWSARWFSFYMAQYERCVLAGPENLRGRNRLQFVDAV